MLSKQQFVDLLMPCERTLYCVARTLLSSDADCADAVQEAVLKAWGARAHYRVAAPFRPWITRILINECHNLHRKRARTVLSPDLAKFESATAKPEHSDLKHALNSLNDKWRLPVVLHYLEGFSVGEVAAVLNIPEGTVKWRLSKARNQLKEWLSDDLL